MKNEKCFNAIILKHLFQTKGSSPEVRGGKLRGLLPSLSIFKILNIMNQPLKNVKTSAVFLNRWVTTNFWSADF